MNADAALGVFDPLALGLTFSCPRPGETGAGTAIAGEAVEIGPDDADALRSAFETLQRVIPAELLAHEMTHLYQVTGTSAGIAEFLEWHRYLLRCCLSITAAAAHGGGAVPVGLLGRAEGKVLPTELVASLEASRDALLVLKGGVLLPLDALAPYRVGRESGSVFRVRGVLPGEEVVWCLDLTTLGGPAGTAVTMGNVALFEGQAHLVEFLRGVGERSRGGAPWSVEDAPPHPYQLARSIYLAYCRDRPADALDADIEFYYVVDAALMAEGNAFDHFMRMCLVLSGRPGWRLTSVRPGDVVAFQDGLLDAVGATVSSVAALTTAALENHRHLLAEIQRESPLFRPMISPWAHAFATTLGERARHGKGGSTGLALATMPGEELTMRAVDVMTTTLFQPVSLTDDITEPAVLSVAGLPHAKSVLTEVLYGGRPCEVRARCALPERAACSGLPRLEELAPKGRRCMREHAVTEVAQVTGIDRLTT